MFLFAAWDYFHLSLYLPFSPDAYVAEFIHFNKTLEKGERIHFDSLPQLELSSHPEEFFQIWAGLGEVEGGGGMTKREVIRHLLTESSKFA